MEFLNTKLQPWKVSENQRGSHLISTLAVAVSNSGASSLPHSRNNIDSWAVRAGSSKWHCPQVAQIQLSITVGPWGVNFLFLLRTHFTQLKVSSSLLVKRTYLDSQSISQWVWEFQSTGPLARSSFFFCTPSRWTHLSDRHDLPRRPVS